MSSYLDLLKWNKQGEDAAGEMWICRAGWARGRDPKWTWGRWTGTFGRNGLGGGAATGQVAGEVRTLEEAQLKIAEAFGPEVAAQVEAVLAADEGKCRKCGEVKPLKSKLAYDVVGVCFVCSEMMGGG